MFNKLSARYIVYKQSKCILKTLKTWINAYNYYDTEYQYVIQFTFTFRGNHTYRVHKPEYFLAKNTLVYITQKRKDRKKKIHVERKKIGRL